MKPALLVALVVVTVATVVTADGWPGFPRKRSLQRRDSTANINEYMDQVLNQTVVYLNENNLEPYTLNDKFAYNLTFKDLLGVTWRTRLGLYSGSAQNLTTLHRISDSQLSYTSDARTINLDATVAFTQLKIIYKYAAQTLNIGPHGTLTAKLKNLTANMQIAVNLRKLNATLENFSLNTAKSIKVDVTGLTLIGNLAAEGFINFFTLILKNTILGVVEGQVRSALVAGVNSTSADSLSIIIGS